MVIHYIYWTSNIGYRGREKSSQFSSNSSTFCSNDDFKWTNDFFFLFLSNRQIQGQTFQPLTPHQFYWRLEPKLILKNTWMHLSKPMINGFLKIDVGSALLRDCLVWCIQKVHSSSSKLIKISDTLSEIAIFDCFYAVLDLTMNRMQFFFMFIKLCHFQLNFDRRVQQPKITCTKLFTITKKNG